MFYSFDTILDAEIVFAQYSIISGNTQHLFAVDADTGVITAYGYPSVSYPNVSVAK